MTALDRFVRLESGGLWRENKDAQRRDVTVSFGKATLVLADGAGRAITHWSLPAVRRLNPGSRPAIYAPDKDAEEALEIEDTLMIDAIEEVRQALRVTAPHPGRLRGALALGLTAACLAATGIWAPGIMRDTAVTVVPHSTTAEIGHGILGHYQRLTGAPCQAGLGAAVLAQLHARLFGAEADGQLIIVQSLPQGAVALPGGLILIDRTLVEGQDDPAILASHILAAAMMPSVNDSPMRRVVDNAKLTDTMTLLTTGDLPDAALKSQAIAIAEGAYAPDPGILDASYQLAASAPPPSNTKGLLTEVTLTHVAQQSGYPLLDDNAWVRLQNICR